MVFLYRHGQIFILLVLRGRKELFIIFSLDDYYLLRSIPKDLIPITQYLWCDTMYDLYKRETIMEPDEMIGDVLDLMDLVISTEALHNQEKGFLAYVLCSKIAKELIEIHQFKCQSGNSIF